jgi:predicted PolB exonuclease-like 3'-5' exonuclease
MLLPDEPAVQRRQCTIPQTKPRVVGSSAWDAYFFTEVAMRAGDVSLKGPTETTPGPAYLILDTESVPDGRLLALERYTAEQLTPQEAVQRAQEEARDRSLNRSDFLPVSYHYPVAVCILRVGSDFTLQALTCLDAPYFRPRKIVEAFWTGLAGYKEKYKDRVKLVTFNGRCFDLPLLELAAFRYGCSGRDYFHSSRNRYGGGHIDLLELLTNFNAIRLSGGLNLLSKLLGKPGKMTVSGDQVYQMHLEGRVQDINDYCMFDTLDTYFVFLRTRLMLGEFDLAQEHRLTLQARDWITTKAQELPALRQYLANWGEWNPWP